MTAKDRLLVTTCRVDVFFFREADKTQHPKMCFALNSFYHIPYMAIMKGTQTTADKTEQTLDITPHNYMLSAGLASYPIRCVVTYEWKLLIAKLCEQHPKLTKKQTIHTTRLFAHKKEHTHNA